MRGHRERYCRESVATLPAIPLYRDPLSGIVRGAKAIGQAMNYLLFSVIAFLMSGVTLFSGSAWARGIGALGVGVRVAGGESPVRALEHVAMRGDQSPAPG